MGDEERLRLFFAVPLAEALRDSACALRDELAGACRRRPRIKWVERPNLHMTLKFLGDTRAGELQRVCRIAERAAEGVGPMSLEVCGVGCFPPRGAPRIIWLGVSRECPELTRLATRLDEALQEAGLAEADRHPFTAHFTVGRVKDRRGGRALRDAIERLSEAPVGCMDVDHFVLISSDLTPQGPVYTERERFELSE
ncbi:MAG: RNA 2',3'-cyclic phosphodiesterase [Armatimonadota bacterium]|nr:RNA 2',3'-cyclic phosphodiesterase [Armatimonadota bacterium]